MWQLIRSYGTAAVATAAAYALLLPVFLAILVGRVRIENYHVALRQVRQGSVLCISNHPTLIETVALPAIFWWLAWCGRGRKVPWSIADNHLFPFLWLYPAFRCIPIERGVGASRRENAKALRRVVELWDTQRSVILYPEGGRTCKGVVFHERSGRRVREPDVTVVAMAAKRRVPILPVWVDQGDVRVPESLLRGYGRLFWGRPLRIRFGHPQLVAETSVTGAQVAAWLLEV